MTTGESGTAIRIDLVNDIRKRVRRWRVEGYPGVTRTTSELLRYWNREDRGRRLFFCQIEAAETNIFLQEARADFLQGLNVPLEEVPGGSAGQGQSAFRRYACKMATGAGKTTVMAMLIAWSVLNKVANRQDSRFSDAILVVCPNITIRERLRELDPSLGEGSTYRLRDLIPAHLMPVLRQAHLVITNWHVFQALEKNQVGGISARVVKIGQESDTALVRRVMGEAIGGKGNILVLNDEAHHAYRRLPNEPPTKGEDELEELETREATVWIGGLDKIDKMRRINFCVDFSATPFFLKGTGKDVGRPFPWVVSDFGLIDAIECGLVKIPQFPIEDTTAGERAAFFNLWKWIVEKRLTYAEKGGRRGQVSPEAVLKNAASAITMLAGKWRETFYEWQEQLADHPTPPVLVVVCKNTALAKLVHEWLLGQGDAPAPFTEFLNEDGQERTVRIDSRVVEELQSGEIKSKEARRLRYVLDTIGKTEWPGGEIPGEWMEIAKERNDDPLTPPGRDVRCIISVSMLTEGWDARTVTHIVGLRPFQSQLLCEQVVGRGLRRTQYSDLWAEEVAVVVGVPFEVIPFKTKPARANIRPKPLWHVHALENRAHFEIRYPRVLGYSFRARSRIKANWDQVPPLVLDPSKYPPRTRVKDLSLDSRGRITSLGPGLSDTLTLEQFRREHRIQELEYELARTVTKQLTSSESVTIPIHALFPQALRIVHEYLHKKVVAKPGTALLDVFLDPYFGKSINALLEGIGPDTSSERDQSGDRPELPRYEASRPGGSTKEIDYWTSRKVVECRKSHLNLAPIDSGWEQMVKFALEEHSCVLAWARNYNLGFAIPYLRDGERHDYIPDFLVRLQLEGREVGSLVLEVKGGQDEWAEVKKAAARRWVKAVNEDGSRGLWEYAMIRDPTEAQNAVEEATKLLASRLRASVGSKVEGRVE